MELRTRIPLGGMVALIAFLAGPCIAYAQSLDPHRLYEERCAKCHAPHAGDFVHDSLVHSDGKVVGRKTSKELRSFLTEGHGKLEAVEIDAIVKHLTSIQKSGRLFHNKCLICHDRAVALARSQLVIRNGRLQGRYSGRDIMEFLYNHGRLEDKEVTTMIQVLKRQLTEDQILRSR